VVRLSGLRKGGSGVCPSTLIPGGWSRRSRSEGTASAEKDGFADLTTDSDYNYLMSYVNANPFPGAALTCWYEKIFPTSPDFITK
jgi:hypothetical protein